MGIAPSAGTGSRGSFKYKPHMKYTYLDHPADAKFRAFGLNLEETFQNAALATAGLMWEVQTISLKKTLAIEVTGIDLKQLLMGFLEEILFLLDTRRFLLGTVESVKLREGKPGYTLQSVFRGDIQTGQYEVFGDVKAITYNEMQIEKNDPCMVQVVVDM